MALRLLEKTERRLGHRLHLKGERCLGPKCAMVRRAYIPGAHGKARQRAPSEYGQLLREKQKTRFIYGLDDKEIKGYIQRAAAKPGIFSLELLRLIESRLDNVVFRLGFADSRRAARHFVKYGHIRVNGKGVNIPSYQVKKGQKISIKEKSLLSPAFNQLDLKLKKYEAPRSWLELDKQAKVGTVVRAHEPEGDQAIMTDFTKIKEFYSR